MLHLARTGVIQILQRAILGLFLLQEREVSAELSDSVSVSWDVFGFACGPLQFLEWRSASFHYRFKVSIVELFKMKNFVVLLLHKVTGLE